ncbi:MAG: nuclear transport factor 2 family protein [Acidobacteriota bacterium]
MATYPEAFDSMLDAWHERDADKVRGHLDQALSPEIYFIDPDNEVRGVDAFEAMVHAFHAKYPTAEFVRTSVVDGHNSLFRYRWEMRVDGATVLPGFDVCEVDGAGKVRQIFGFFGHLEDAA